MPSTPCICPPVPNPVDPCGHGDTSEGCTRHDPTLCDSNHWVRALAEAYDAIGAARDALAATRTNRSARRAAAEDLDFWQGRKAFAEAARTEYLAAR